MNKKGIKKYIILFLSAIILTLPFFCNGFLIKNDFLSQHIPFYQEFYQMLDARSLEWAWNYFFGINFFGSKAYYMVGDIFAWIGYIFYKCNLAVVNVLFLVTFAKLIIAGIGFEKYLEKLNIKEELRVLFAISYMCSGWVTIFVEQPVFITFYAFIPFMLTGMEDYLQYDKGCLFVISSSLILMAQYYLLWPLCVFLLVYWILRYIQVTDVFDFKTFFIKSFKLLGLFLVALMISAIIWLPSLLHLLTSPRLSADSELINYGLIWNVDEVLQIIQNFFIPVVKSELSLYRGYWYYFYQIGIYCGCFSVLLAFLYPFTKNIDKKTKVCDLILLFFGIIILLSPQIGVIFHFTYSLRYTFITEIILLIVAAKALNNIVVHKINKRAVLIVGTIMLCFIIGLTFVVPSYRGIDATAYPEYKMYLFVMALVILYCVMLIIINQKNYKLFTILGMVEILILGSFAMYHQINSDMVDQEYLDNEMIYQEIIMDIKEMDDSFYRVYFDHHLSNLGLYFNIPSVSTYDSTYEYCLHDFLYILREYPDVEWNFKIDYPQLYELLNVKYVITNETLDISRWQYYGKEIKRYENGYILFAFDNIEPSLGRSYNKFTSKEEMIAKSEDDNYYLHEIIDQMNIEAIVDEPEKFDKYVNNEIIHLNPSYINNDTVIFEFSCEENQFLYFSIPNDKGWKVYDNGQLLEKVDVNGGFIGVEVDKGNHVFRMEYDVYGLKVALGMSFAGVLSFVALLWRKKQKNLLK